MQSCPKPANLLQELRKFDTFSEVEDGPLAWMIGESTYHCLEQNETFFRPGDPIDHMHLLLTGGYLVRQVDPGNGRKRDLGVWEAPMVTGLLPFSRLKTATAEAITIAPTTILSLHRDCFTDMVNQSYALTQALVAVMTNRVRDFQQMRLMDEKLMALGKMSAGLAHELNNPAAAMVRSSRELHKHLAQTPERFKQLVTMRVDADDVDEVNRVMFGRIAARKESGGDALSLMEREARNDDLLDWFEDNNIPDCEEVVDTLVDWDFTPEHLDQIAAVLPPRAVKSVIWWIDTSLTTESLVDEIQAASSRISELVKSIKSYSHMDSEPSMEFIDIHEGLISTLTMLKFRFKKKGIELRKEWDRDLPFIKALAGELNQVWTNVIVNALDALGDRDGGKITIRTYVRHRNICIDIEDNGPGIPEDIQSRVFEPFYTTKGIGEGTGMGLDIVRRVLDHHGGSINLESAPGRTCFRVCFPL